MPGPLSGRVPHSHALVYISVETLEADSEPCERITGMTRWMHSRLFTHGAGSSTRCGLLLLALAGQYPPPYYENGMVLLLKEPKSPPGDLNEPNEHLDTCAHSLAPAQRYHPTHHSLQTRRRERDIVLKLACLVYSPPSLHTIALAVTATLLPPDSTAAAKCPALQPIYSASSARS
jgi:hypothetical protein